MYNGARSLEKGSSPEQEYTVTVPMADCLDDSFLSTVDMSSGATEVTENLLVLVENLNLGSLAW